jgi:hypothetical protein
MSNKQPFGSFKNRSTKPTTVDGRPIVFETLTGTNNTYTVQGGPGLDADGNPLPWPNPGWTPTADQPDPPPMPLGHSLARQWGDKSAYHVGSNYAEQEGDTTVVSVGNSSTKRTGWANNVQDGNTFTTQIGCAGNFSTSFFTLGFQVGSKVNVSASLDVSLTTGFKIIANASPSFVICNKDPKYEMHNWKFVCDREKTELTTKFNNISTQINTVSGLLNVVSTSLYNKCAVIENTTAQLTNTCTNLQNNFGAMTSKGLACTFDVTDYQIKAASITLAGVLIKLG